MHSILHGVIKTLFHFWFDQKYSSEQFSLRKNIQEIDKILVMIKPPSFFPCAPRSIQDYSNWRAKEFLLFIIYYSVPVFFQIMPDDLYNNLLKLVVFLEFILSRTIKFTSLNVLQTLIESYVSELSVLYKPSIMLSGTHELLHFIQITEDFGPVNFTNCFVYEELNRKVSSMLHGFDLIGEEFIKLYSTLQYCSRFRPSRERLRGEGINVLVIYRSVL